MSIPKCPHGCYNGTKDGEPSDYCSGCRPPDINLNGVELGKLEIEWEKRLVDNTQKS